MIPDVMDIMREAPRPATFRQSSEVSETHALDSLADSPILEFKLVARFRTPLTRMTTTDPVDGSFPRKAAGRTFLVSNVSTKVVESA